MMDPADLSVCAAAAALRRGDISALALVEACLGRIVFPRGQALNAFIHVAAETARAQARASDLRRAIGRPLSPLDGVPLAVKDNIDVLGMPTTNGLGIRWMPEADAPVVRRLRDAGMTILGKLNMHEAALGATNDNPHYGRCEHPAFPGFTPGGSSGGSAAAVAGGLCPVTLGTDTMGSVRLPAAYCGIVGFKPSRNYWPIAGVAPLAFGLDTIGLLAATVTDIALILGESLSTSSLDLRLACLNYAELTAVEIDCQTAFDAAIDTLRAHHISITAITIPGYDPGIARRAGFIVSEVDAAGAHASLLASTPQAFSPTLLSMLTYGSKVTADRFQREKQIIGSAAASFRTAFAGADVILSLTAPQRTFRFDTPVPPNQADLTAIANFVGCPAISVPLPVPLGTPPIGLQLLAPVGHDKLLLSTAAYVEAALSN